MGDNGVLIVMKTGAEMFDTLHTLGLCVVLSFAYKGKVRVENVGGFYRISYHKKAIYFKNDSVKDLLPLPSLDEFRDYVFADHPNLNFSINILNGLLLAGISLPNRRIASIDVLRNYSQVEDSDLSIILEKVSRIRERLSAFVSRRAETLFEWIQQLETEYDANKPIMPIAIIKRSTSDRIPVPIAIDPAYSFSSRRPWGDCNLYQRTQVSFDGTTFATILAFIGASRFLRLFHSNNEYLGTLVVQFDRVVVFHEEVYPKIKCREIRINASILYETINLLKIHRVNRKLLGDPICLTFRIFKNQKAKNILPLFGGNVNYELLKKLTVDNTKKLIGTWTQMLMVAEVNDDFGLIDSTLEFLSERSSTSLLEHIKRISLYNAQVKNSSQITYALLLVKEIAHLMDTSQPSQNPLSHILKSKSGTIRFGHALRQIYKFNFARARDIIDELNSIQDRDQLIRVIAIIVQENQLIIGKNNPFGIVPKDLDFIHLLEDIELYGSSTVASILIALASLRFDNKKAEQE